MSGSIADLVEEVNFYSYMVDEYQKRKYMPDCSKMIAALAHAEFKLEMYMMEMAGRAK